MTHPGGAPEWLDQLTISVMAHIAELIRNVPGGSDEERAVLATAVIAEVLARSLEAAGGPSVSRTEDRYRAAAVQGH